MVINSGINSCLLVKWGKKMFFNRVLVKEGKCLYWIIVLVFFDVWDVVFIIIIFLIYCYLCLRCV